MRHLKSYRLYEKVSGKSLLETADSLLGDLAWWREDRIKISPSILLEIDTESKRTAEAHFSLAHSTPQKVVIQMEHMPKTMRDKSSLAHEVSHAVQWITGTDQDLMFITDATRELVELSDSPLWGRVLYSIYLSHPPELQAWQAGSLYYREPILNDIVPWMRSFNSIRIAEDLRSSKINKNQWGIESFDEFPSFWSDAYNEYNEPVPDSPIPAMMDLTLEEFLDHYSKLFKKVEDVLG